MYVWLYGPITIGPHKCLQMSWLANKSQNTSGNECFDATFFEAKLIQKIAFAPICVCKNNRRLWRHNASISRSRDVTDQLWWRHYVQPEKAVLCDNVEMSDRLMFTGEFCVQDIK